MSKTDAVRMDPIDEAITAMAEGRAVIAVDDEGRENEGDLIFAAEKATPELTAFMIRHTSGYICVGMTGEDLDRLHLPPMTVVNEDRKGTAYAVTVDARCHGDRDLRDRPRHHHPYPRKSLNHRG